MTWEVSRPARGQIERLIVARDRCLTARDRAEDKDMRTFWTHSARHFEMALGLGGTAGAMRGKGEKR
jgi:hypothetical protein